MLIDDNKNLIPVQYKAYSFFLEVLRSTFPDENIPEEGYVFQGGLRIVFTAEDVPGYGYKTYYLKHFGGEEVTPSVKVEDMYKGQVTESGVRASSIHTLENQFYKVTVNAGIGWSKSSNEQIPPQGRIVYRYSFLVPR